jgi:phospholipid transport system substrate-binding protein
VRYLWGLCLGLVLLGPAYSASADEVVPPDRMLEQTAHEMLTVLRQRQQELRGNTAELYRLVEDILVPHVDLELLARFVLGKHWRNATEEQRTRFTYAFKDMLIRFYATSMLEYLDYQVRFFPVTLSPGDKLTVVRSEFYRGHQAPIAVNYRVALRDGEWKAFDVTIDNISVVTNYRGSFDSIIQNEGLESLLRQMDAWNQDKAVNLKNPNQRD